jgi:hypothetical protein
MLAEHRIAYEKKLNFSMLNMELFGLQIPYNRKHKYKHTYAAASAGEACCKLTESCI